MAVSIALPDERESFYSNEAQSTVVQLRTARELIVETHCWLTRSVLIVCSHSTVVVVGEVVASDASLIAMAVLVVWVQLGWRIEFRSLLHLRRP